MRALRFGLGLSSSAAPRADPLGQARRAERLGFDFVSASDHPSGAHPSFEAWTLLSFVAAVTDRVQVVTRVLSVPFRPPALVAKMAESLDRLSGGRLVLGLGAGATDDELRGFGLQVPSPREKVEGLRDALEVIRGLWSKPEFSYDGARHHTDRAVMEPKPSHGIPIWLGTFGDRALATTGMLADGWIPSYGYVPVAALVAMREKVLAAAESCGRARDAVTCALNLEVSLGGGARLGPEVISGSCHEVAERLGCMADLGFSAFNFIVVGDDHAKQVEALAGEVIPALRDALSN